MTSTEFDLFFSPQTLPSGNSSMLFVGADVGGVSHATLPPCPSVLVCPCLACPPLHLPPAVSFLRASSSEPKQQFHLFCQGWECTQPSLAVFLPAPLDAKPVDLTHMPALLFLFSFTASVWFGEGQDCPALIWSLSSSVICWTHSALPLCAYKRPNLSAKCLLWTLVALVINLLSFMSSASLLIT